MNKIRIPDNCHTKIKLKLNNLQKNINEMAKVVPISQKTHSNEYLEKLEESIKLGIIVCKWCEEVNTRSSRSTRKDIGKYFYKSAIFFIRRKNSLVFKPAD